MMMKEDVKRLMSRMNNTGYLRDINLDTMSPLSLESMFRWLQQIELKLNDLERKVKRGF